WELPMAYALDSAVVQVEVSDLERGCARHPVRVTNYRESMVLRGDQHAIGADVTHGMIAAAMAIRKLGRRAPEGEAHELVAQADAKRRQSSAGEVAQRAQRVVDRGGIAGTIGKEEPVR